MPSRAGLDIDPKDPLEALRPSHRGAAFNWRGLLRIVPGLLAMVAFLTLVQDPQHSTNPALESTVTADMVQAETLTMSIGALGTVNGAAKFLSSASVGIVWTVVSPTFAFALAAGFMLAGTLAILRVRD